MTEVQLVVFVDNHVEVVGLDVVVSFLAAVLSVLESEL